MKKYIIAVLIFGLTAMFILAGCGDRGEPETEAENSAETTTGEEAQAPEVIGQSEAGESTVVTDQLGRTVSIEGAPQRIVSLSPSNTEILFALGLGDRVVGVTDFCNFPPEAMEIDKIGGFNSPSIEKIAELDPDLVLASTNDEEELPLYESLGLTVMVVESASLFELYATISLIAEVSGDIFAGEELIVSMQGKINAVEEIIAEIALEDRPLVYYEVYSEPLMSAGNSVIINEIIFLAGGVNIFADIDEGYPTISAEVVADREPDIIIYPDAHGTAEMVFGAMIERSGWESVPAVKNNKVYAISADPFARPGPRVAEAVEIAAKLFYPELF